MVGMCDFPFIDSFDSMGCNVRRSKHIKPVLVPLGVIKVQGSIHSDGTQHVHFFSFHTRL